jgi:hypothetical protein
MARIGLLVASIAFVTIAIPRLAAQKTVIEPGVTDTMTATVQTIDTPNRLIVLHADDGSDKRVFAPPEFTRFNELRVGDRLTITYYQSTVYQLKHRHAPAPAVSEAVAGAESRSSLPGGTLSYQATERVTVTAVDRNASLITVVGRDGRMISRRVHDISTLDGVKKGDRIDITYTEALLASFTRPQ